MSVKQGKCMCLYRVKNTIQIDVMIRGQYLILYESGDKIRTIYVNR